MNSYIDPGDDSGRLLMSPGSVSKYFGGQGQRIGETASFTITFRQNTGPEGRNYFVKICGRHPEKIGLFLPCNDMDRCVAAPYQAFNGGRTMPARSDGEIFTYIANPDDPLNTAEPYLRDVKRCGGGQVIPYRPGPGFPGKPDIKMKMDGQMFVFIKELLKAGVFQIMAFRFHTTEDRNMLRNRLCFIRDSASGINVPLTAVPMFLTKFREMKNCTDPNGACHSPERFYPDPGPVNFTVADVSHSFSAAFSSNATDHLNDYCKGIENRENFQEEPDRSDTEELQNDRNEEETRKKDDTETARQTPVTDDRWKDDVFVLTDDQQNFIRENVSSCGSRYGIKAELPENYRDRTGTGVSALPPDNLLTQIKKADEYLLKIMHKEISVDKQTETRARMPRRALITAALIKHNRYVCY